MSTKTASAKEVIRIPARLMPPLLWTAVGGLGIYVGGYLLASAALLVTTYSHSRKEVYARWLQVVLEPPMVWQLLLSDKQVQTYAFGFGVLLLCLLLWSILELRGSAPRPSLASRYGSHGTGRWAHPDEILGHFGLHVPGAILGRLMAQRHWHPIILPWAIATRNRFVLIIGPPGSGKTSRYTLPNLLHAAAIDPKRSLLVTDPKGELYQETAALLRSKGFAIRAINLLQPQASDRYNPMDYVRTVEDAFRLANTIIVNTSGQSVTGDAFWVNAERSLLTCLIWYVKSSLQAQHQHLATVLAVGTAFGKDPKLMDAVFTAKGRDPTARSLYDQVACLSGKTRDGVYIGFAVRLQLWSSREIAALTAHSDFHLRDLGRKPTALFVIIPDHHSTYQALTSLFFDQVFQELIDEADATGGRLTCEVRLLLEEMANIGRVPDLEKRLATIRSRGLLVEMVLQTIGQLKALYGEAWNTITGCADTVVALAANDQETAEWLSRRLGTSTIRTTSTSNTATERGESQSQSLHYTSRALMLPDEVQGQGEQGLKQDELLLIHRGLPPARLYKYPVDEFPGAQGLTKANHRLHPAPKRPKEPAPLPDLAKLVPDQGQGEKTPENQDEKSARDQTDKSPAWLAETKA